MQVCSASQWTAPFSLKGLRKRNLIKKLLAQKILYILIALIYSIEFIISIVFNISIIKNIE